MGRRRRKRERRDGSRPGKATRDGQPHAGGPQAGADDAALGAPDRESLAVAAAELDARVASFSLAAAETLDALQRRIESDLPSDVWRAPELVQAWDALKHVNARLKASLQAGELLAVDERFDAIRLQHLHALAGFTREVERAAERAKAERN